MKQFHIIKLLFVFIILLLGSSIASAAQQTNFPLGSLHLSTAELNTRSPLSTSVKSTTAATGEVLHNPLLYGYIYWENGYPAYNTTGKRRPDSWDNPDFSANPNVVIQTGYYNLRFDADDINLTGYDASVGSDYLSALHEDVTTFTPASLLLALYKDDIRYTANVSEVDTDDLHVRLIEMGQYVQRFDHTNISFLDTNGNELDEEGHFEITAWPDRVVFSLDFSNSPDVTRTTIRVISPDGVRHLQDQLTNEAHLAIAPQDDEKLSLLVASDYVTSAIEKDTNEPLDLTFDENEYALRLDLQPERVNYPEDIARFDEYVFTINNPNSEITNIPLVFNQISPPKITGTVMILTEEDGNPSGIPVQVSKNWHKDADSLLNHQGSWLRGSTMVTLPEKGSKTFNLRVIYGYWDEAGAVSHSQLSLIGWGGNWKWDESALGAWGESMTFDPTQHIGSSFMADVRPTWTTPMSTKTSTHNWTENLGGGDFLKYFDEDGNYRWAKRLKTAYRWTGPNITEVLYSGITDDEKIRLTYKTQFVRSNDYNRRFQTYRYEILEDIDSPERFVYYQMAADYYHSNSFDDYYVGDSTGQVSAISPTHGGNAYAGEPFVLNDSWLMIDDYYDGAATGVRGILSGTATFNGQPQNLYVHPYGRKWGAATTLFDISASSIGQSYSAGDVIEGELTFILPAKSEAHYWGADTEFNQRLSEQENVWESVEDEFEYNTEMIIQENIGTIVNDYPVVVDTQSSSETILAHFTIPANQGIGHIPVILANAGQGLALSPEIYVNNEWQYAVNNDDNIAINASYQGYLNADGTMDYAFNIQRPEGTLDQPMAVRILSSYIDPTSVSLSTTNVAKESLQSYLLIIVMLLLFVVLLMLWRGLKRR